MNHLIVIMGVAASGKSTIASRLSDAKGWQYLEGDEFHPEANVEKMAGGTPLTNKDREAWIDAMALAVVQNESDPIILSCSALNAFVRNRLQDRCDRAVSWVYLKVPREELIRRIEERENHFMKEAMLDSQLSALEPPEDCLEVDADHSIEETISKIKSGLTLQS